MVDREEVLEVARLARLELRPEDLERLAGQFGRILDYMELLREVDDEAPLPPPVAVALRPDEVRPGLTREEALAHAPKSDGETFLVPPVILPGDGK
ncbi:MAG: glutamyl-tRNA(Gln) amidotransferase subunit C [Gemmatimonadota bacterium]|nr:MAG: glutamyl-tRNA(Gln) amidotransferase subunit C [Gemmatimonadota bacterium]